MEQRPKLGTLIVGAAADTLSEAASLAASDPNVAVVDVRVVKQPTLIDIASRYRSQGLHLIVLTEDELSLPREVLVNLERRIDCRPREATAA